MVLGTPRPSRPRIAAGLALAVTALLAGPSPPALRAQDPAPALVDQLGTLSLTEDLDSRGALGGVAVDALGFVYVANFRDKVWRVDPESGAVRLLSDALYGASGNAIGPGGELYQASFLSGTVTRLDRAGEATVVATGLAGPVGIAVGESRELYVAECRGNKIARVSPDGAVETFAESELFACPNGLAMGDDGNLYVASFNRLELARVDPSGNVSAWATVPGAPGNAHIAFARGFLYVTKILANQVVKVSPDGDVLPVAGSGQAGHDDGPAPVASLSRPNGIAVSPTGDRLYVNTLVGEYRQPRPSTITMRTLDLLTLRPLLERALETGGVEEAEAIYRRYRSDPVRGREDTLAEVSALGYALLTQRRVTEAVAVFRLNTEGHPESATAWFQLGEAYRYTGRPEEAAEQYRRALEIDPEHAAANAALHQVAPVAPSPGTDGP